MEDIRQKMMGSEIEQNIGGIECVSCSLLKWDESSSQHICRICDVPQAAYAHVTRYCLLYKLGHINAKRLLRKQKMSNELGYYMLECVVPHSCALPVIPPLREIEDFFSSYNKSFVGIWVAYKNEGQQEVWIPSAILDIDRDKILCNVAGEKKEMSIHDSSVISVQDMFDLKNTFRTDIDWWMELSRIFGVEPVSPMIGAINEY